MADIRIFNNNDTNGVERKVLIFDVDGIILDYNTDFVKFWDQGLKEGKWSGPPLDGNPTTWTFGFTEEDDQTELDKAIWEFHDIHEPLPLLHDNIKQCLRIMAITYDIVLVSSYPDVEKRKRDLLFHDLFYHTLVCNVKNKVEYIKSMEDRGREIVAIFEDGPHHIDTMLPRFFGKIWAPRYWNYLKKYQTVNNTGIRFYSDPIEWLSL